ncbi:MAG TPA: TetR/AcrR family transcriptional regulator [Candidatus Limnocylindrales bacterium]|nr:TetR/AcrR family transcriptional regulator [Candidatus Limnocylindrales bacterium]
MPALAEDPTIRRQVMSAAREVLAGDAGAPVAVIADRAGVSRATFYRHFGSRASLLRSVELEPRPDARARILAAAKDMLLTSSLAELSMEELAVAADVSRGTLYRLVPGKPALLAALIQAYSPFESVRAIIVNHPDDPPEVVLPQIGRAVVGVAGERFGLMRAVFHEVTARSGPGMAGMGPLFAQTLGQLADYMARQMAAGRIRRMPPILALQAVVGPIFFHLMTRAVIERAVDLPSPEAAVDELVASALAGLRP